MMHAAEYLFVVRNSEDQTPFIAMQPRQSQSVGLSSEVNLLLYRGTSLEEAKQLARFLNSNIKAVRYEDKASAFAVETAA